MIREEYITDKLILSPLSIEDNNFIFELLNSEGWIKFIGNRNIKTIDDAKKYIDNLLSNETSYAWVVKLREVNTPIGIITFLKKTYLEHPDLGFAFLPQYIGKGYALEASLKILHNLALYNIKTIAAVTVKENYKSAGLLNRLGFTFFRTITEGDEELIYYLYKG